MRNLLYFFTSILMIFGSKAFAENTKDSSIFNLTSSWLNQDGKEVLLKDLSGKKTILSMTYTSCPHSCPLTISKMKSLYEALSTSAQQRTRLVIASFDPKHDTPTQLKKYIDKRQLNTNIWTFLTAQKDSSVRELAVVLGVNYKPVGKTDFSHSNVVTLLDENGAVLTRLESLNADHKLLLEMAEKK